LLLLLLLVSQESAVQPSLTERPKVISVRTLRARMSGRGTRAPWAMPEMCQLLVAILFLVVRGCLWRILALHFFEISRPVLADCWLEIHGQLPHLMPVLFG
jgi:hypothetical protein